MQDEGWSPCCERSRHCGSRHPLKQGGKDHIDGLVQEEGWSPCCERSRHCGNRHPLKQGAKDHIDGLVQEVGWSPCCERSRHCGSRHPLKQGGKDHIDGLVQEEGWSPCCERSRHCGNRHPLKQGAKDHIDGLVQDCGNSRVLATELLQSCVKPWISLYPKRSSISTLYIAGLFLESLLALHRPASAKHRNHFTNMHQPNERRRYNVMSSLIGWAHSQNDPYKHQPSPAP